MEEREEKKGFIVEAHCQSEFSRDTIQWATVDWRLNGIGSRNFFLWLQLANGPRNRQLNGPELYFAYSLVLAYQTSSNWLSTGSLWFGLKVRDGQRWSTCRDAQLDFWTSERCHLCGSQRPPLSLFLSPLSGSSQQVTSDTTVTSFLESFQRAPGKQQVMNRRNLFLALAQSFSLDKQTRLTLTRPEVNFIIISIFMSLHHCSLPNRLFGRLFSCSAMSEVDWSKF